MPPLRTRLLLGSGLALATLAVALADGGSDGGTPRIDARTISGTISTVTWSDATITVDASDGPVTLRIDRNTAVFLDNRLGSARDLTVGTPVRASFGADKRAVWVEVRSHPPATVSSQDGGLQKADGGARDAGATADGLPALPPPAGAPAVDAGSPDAGPQPAAADGGPGPPSSIPAGPSPPEPGPGATPPRPPAPGPAGPGPVPIGS